MKLPKVWGPFDPMGSAPGISKSNSLEIIDAPFLTAAGPGFVTYKKDGFTKIILEGGESGPFIWGITTHRLGDEVMSVGDPSNGTVINTGVKQYATNLGLRVGAGNILSVARSPVHEEAWPLLVDVNSSQPKVVSYEGLLKLPQDPDPRHLGPTSLAAMFATGKDSSHKAYRWGVARFGYFDAPTYTPVPDPAWSSETRVNWDEYTSFEQSWLTRDVDGHIVPTTQTDYTPIRNQVTTTGTHDHGYPKQSHYPSFTVHLGDTALPKEKGGDRWSKVVYLVDGHDVDRDYKTAGPFCIGPGRLAALIVPADAVYIPGTSWSTLDYVDDSYYWDFDTHGTYWGADVAVPVHFPIAEIRGGLTAIVFVNHANYLPSIPPYLMISEDHGETWSRKNLEDCFDIKLFRAPGVSTFHFDDAIGNYTGTVHTSEYYDGYDTIQLEYLARGFYMCYIGEGKSIVLIPALTPRPQGTEGSPVTGVVIPFTTQVACFLFDYKSRTGTRLSWPGDSTTTNIDVSQNGEVGRSISGCFGVGCFMVVDRDGQIISTRDFGATWTATNTVYPQYVFDGTYSYSSPLALWPTVINRYQKTKKADGTETTSKGMIAFSFPASGVYLAYADGEFGSYWNFGKLYSMASAPDSVAPRITAYIPNFYALYYGRPGLRNSPRPELGNEFDKVTT